MGLLQLFDAKVAEAIDGTFFAVVLDGDGAAGIEIVFDFGGDDAVDFDFDFVAFAGDAVGVPVVAFEGVASAGAEGGDAFSVDGFLFGEVFFGGAFFQLDVDRADEPHATAFVVESAGPLAVFIAIDFGLVAVNFVGFDETAEDEAAIGFAFGEMHIAFKDEVAVGFFGDDEEFLFAAEVDFAINDFGFAPFVGVFPAIESFAVEKVDETVIGLCGEGDGGEQDGSEKGASEHGVVFEMLVAIKNGAN